MRPPQEPPPQPPGAPAGPPGLPGRRRLAALVVVLLAVAGVVTYVVLQTTDTTVSPDTATSPTPAGARPAAGDAAGSPQPAASGAEAVESGVAVAAEPVVVSSDADGVFTVTVFGEDYVLPGPPGGVRGALAAGEVESWTYDFEQAAFVAGDSPAAPFDPAARQAERDYEIAWVSSAAGPAAAEDLEAALLDTAAASGVHIGVVCDGASGAEEALACAEMIAASDADAVIVGNLPGEAAAPAMEVFHDAALPVVTFDTWHPDAVFVGANSYESGAVAGVQAGRHALDAWDCAGIHVLLGDVAHLSGQNNADLALIGFADGVQAVCGADVPVSRIEATTSIRQSTVDWLGANPDAAHVVATSVTDDLTVDMSLALQQTDRSGITAAPVAGRATTARLAEGPPEQTRYLGAATTVPETIAANTIAALIEILEDRSVPQEIRTDSTWLTHDSSTTSPQSRPPPATTG